MLVGFTPFYTSYLMFKARSNPQVAAFSRKKILLMPIVSMFFMSYSFYSIDQEYDRLGTKYLSHLTDEELLAYDQKRRQDPDSVNIDIFAQNNKPAFELNKLTGTEATTSRYQTM